MLNYFQISTGKKHINRFGVNLLLTEHLRMFNYLGFTRINVEVKNNDKDYIYLYGLDTRVCLLVVNCPINFEEIPTEDITKVLFNLAFKALKELWVKKEWNLYDIEKTFDLIKKNNYLCEVVYFKKRRKKGASIYSEVIIEITDNEAKFFLRVYNNNSLYKKILIIKTFAITTLFNRFFHKAYWGDEDIFIIVDKQNEISFLCDIHREEVKIDFHEKKHSLPELKRFFYLLQYDYSNENLLYELPLVD
jgi:hypothetical protein